MRTPESRLSFSPDLFAGSTSLSTEDPGRIEE